MQFKLLVVKVLLNFMVSFQGKLHAMYYLIDCFLLLNIHLFPPPVFSLISRDDNDFSGRKGEQLMELERDLPEEQGCRREVTAKNQAASLELVPVIFSQQGCETAQHKDSFPPHHRQPSFQKLMFL